MINIQVQLATLIIGNWILIIGYSYQDRIKLFLLTI
jgi:hypothetical protein